VIWTAVVLASRIGGHEKPQAACLLTKLAAKSAAKPGKNVA